MRVVIMACLSLAACGQVPAGQAVYSSPEALADYDRRLAEYNQRQEAALTPQQLTERAATAREDELLERALTAAPDYTTAVRRAAVANVAAAPAAAPGARARPETPQVREQRIAAEEARLFDAVERRRRQRLQQAASDDQQRRDVQAVAECDARGNQMEAAYFRPRSLLNLDGMIAGAQSREACLNAYRQSR